MKIGLVGTPNAGKSTLFNTLIGKAQAVVANYPFCTIDPNVGKVPVQDLRLEALAKAAGTKVLVPTRIDVVDIAGLIKGAAAGAGLGNEFLENIRNVDLILNVVRCFDDPETGEKANPSSDIETIQTELILSDIQRIERYIAKNKRDPKLDTLQKAIELLSNEKGLLGTFQDMSIFQELGLLSIKPKIVVANMDLDQLAEYQNDTQDLSPIKLLIKSLDSRETLPCNAQTSDKLIDDIIKKAYDKLDLITFFTAGEKEARAWTANKGEFLYIASSAIHNDFKDKFIRANVVSFDDFIACNGWNGAKSKGKQRVEGKKYVVADGDVCLFMI